MCGGGSGVGVGGDQGKGWEGHNRGTDEPRGIHENRKCDGRGGGGDGGPRVNATPKGVI